MTDAISVPCDVCAARPGEPCAVVRIRRGIVSVTPREPHKARIRSLSPLTPKEEPTPAPTDRETTP